MVLEFEVPKGGNFQNLTPLIPILLSYLLSFIYIGIYWNNHHHMMYITKKINGAILWANLHLLFWLSLIPFTTAWMGENDFDADTVVLYGLVLLMNAVAWYILQRCILNAQGGQSLLSKALGSDWKGKLSPFLYVTAIGSAYISTYISGAIYVVVAVMWIIPDRRIEHILNKEPHPGED